MAAKMAALHLLQRYVGRGFSPPSGFPVHGGQDGRPTSTSMLCRAGIPPRRLGFFTHSGQDGRLTSTSMLCHQASLSMAAKMAAQHLPQCYVGRGFSPPSAFFTDGGQDGRPTFTSTICRAGILPAVGLPCTWRPRWPPYIYLKVM